MSTKRAQTIETKITDKRPRLYYLDWLRVFAIGVVFFFHNGMFFSSYDFHIKNGETSFAVTNFVSFLTQWMMPLFFFIAGASVYYALQVRSARQFIRERGLRLMIPFVFGMFVIAPPQVFLERLANSQFAGNYLQFYPHYFEGIYGFGGNFATSGLHLWFLLFLFIFSVVTLPLLLPKKESGKSFISRFATLFERPWALLLLFLPLAPIDILSDMAGLDPARGFFGGWIFFAYVLFFIYGYLVISSAKIREIIRRYGKIAFVGAVAATIIGFILRYQVDIQSYGTHGYVGMVFLNAFRGWFWIIAIVGLANRFLNFSNRFVKYANEAVLPFYVLHQTIILGIGFHVVQWSVGIPAKYAIISSLSFAATMAVYELLIRRVNVFRVLFGMRSKKRQPEAQLPPFPQLPG